MGNLELCCIVDQYEFVHSHLHACQFADPQIGRDVLDNLERLLKETSDE